MSSITSRFSICLVGAFVAMRAAGASIPIGSLLLTSPADAAGHTISNLPSGFASQIGAATTGNLAAASALLNARIDTIELTGATSLDAVLTVGNSATQDIVRVYGAWSSPLATYTNVVDFYNLAVSDSAASAAASNAVLQAGLVPYSGASGALDLGAHGLSFARGTLSGSIAVSNSVTTADYHTIEPALWLRPGFTRRDGTGYFNSTALLIQQRIDDGRAHAIMDAVWIDTISAGTGSVSSVAGLYVAEQNAAGSTNSYTIATGRIGNIFFGNKTKIAPGVYLGEAAPEHPLDVRGIIQSEAETGGTLVVRRTDTSVSAGDTLGSVQWRAKDTSTTTNEVAAEIRVTAPLTISSNINPGDMAFLTTPTNVAATATERMRIAASGNVGIGTNAPVTALHVAGVGSFDGIRWRDQDTGAYVETRMTNLVITIWSVE